MAFDLSRLRRGEMISAAGGVLLFILLFFNWYDYSVELGGLGSFGGGASAWEAFGFVDIYLLIVVLAAVGLAVLTATQRTPALPVTASVIVTALAAIGTLLVLYRLIDVPGGDVPDAIDVGRTVWAYLGLIVVAGIAYGGYLSMREEGTTLSDAKDQARAAGSQARAAFDSAAPQGGGGGSSTPPPAASEQPAVPVSPTPPPPPPAASEQPAAPVSPTPPPAPPLASEPAAPDDDPAPGSPPPGSSFPSVS